MNNKKFTTEEMLTQALEKIKEQEKQIARLKSNQETDQSPNNTSSTKNESLTKDTHGPAVASGASCCALAEVNAPAAAANLSSA